MPTGASGVSRVRRLPQVGVRRWITFPNPALHSKALNRSEPTLTKRKILVFSRGISMQRLRRSGFPTTRPGSSKGSHRLHDDGASGSALGTLSASALPLPKSSPCMGLRFVDFRRFILGVRLRPDAAIDFNQCRGCGSLTNIDRLRRWTRGESCQKQSLAGTRSHFSDWEGYWAWPDRA